MKTVWICTDTAKKIGDEDHIKVFASIDDRRKSGEDPEGAAFEYAVLE
ncbi:hypothetical protein [Bradyrhizobium elkanii]|nr:hypothetical protein [Bradyrhizobium elkanii]MBR1160254.1 hypothetical protein [Bradyrhizobium elkanii]